MTLIIATALFLLYLSTFLTRNIVIFILCIMTACLLLYNIRPKLDNLPKNTKSNKSTYCPRYYIRSTRSNPHRIATKNQPPPIHQSSSNKRLHIPPMQLFYPDWLFHLPPRLSKYHQLQTWCISYLANDKNISAPDAPTDKSRLSQPCFVFP